MHFRRAILVCFLSFVGLFLPGCERAHAQSGAVDSGQTVYVTNSGKSYHRENCRSLRASKIAVTLADAVKSGYSPCGICKPPTLAPQAAAPEVAPTPGTALYRLNGAGLKSVADADWNRMIPAEVVSCVDGDTIRVRIPNPPEGLGVAETIRMLGADTPETVHPSRPVEYFGREASDYTKRKLTGKTVRLCFDWDLRDRYGRLLAYIFTAPGDCYNAEIIREGYAHAYLNYAFAFKDEFSRLQNESRTAKNGLWAEK